MKPLPALLALHLLTSTQLLAVTVGKTAAYDHSSINAAINDPAFAGESITLGPGVYEEDNIRLHDRSLVAEIPGDPSLTVVTGPDASDGDDIFSSVANATIKGITIRNGRSGIRTAAGAGSTNNITLENLVIENNADTPSSSNGGGINAPHGDLAIVDCVIRGNQGATGAGVCYYAPGCSLMVTGTTIENNVGSGSNEGGGLCLDPQSSMLIEDSTIQNNTAYRGAGCAIWGSAILRDVLLINNKASDDGGAIYKGAIGEDTALLTVLGGRIEGNEGDRGGGIYLRGSTPALRCSAIITNNIATRGDPGSGGGIRCSNSNQVELLADSVFSNTPDDATCDSTEFVPPVDETPVDASHAGTRWASTANDPINTFNGELFSSKPRDLDLGGPMPLYFQRYYAAYLRRSFIVGDLGSNWRHNFDARLFASGNTLRYVSSDGRVTSFIKDLGDGTWTQQDNVDTPYQLSTPPGENYALYDPETERVYTFDFTTNNTLAGKLAKIEDGRGNSHTLTYDPATGHLQSVSDGLGRTLNFTYNTDTIPKIAEVNDGTRSIAFQYNDPIDSEYLTHSTDARSKTTEYQYLDTSSVADHALMTRMLRPRGNAPYRQTFYGTDTPLASGRVATQTDADGHTFEFTYNGLDTTLKEPGGATRVHTHTATGEFANRTDQQGASFSMTSDPTGRRSGLTDRLGGTTAITYHPPSGKLASITNANGETTTYHYTPRPFGPFNFYDLTRVTFPDDTSESFARDTNGNPVSRTRRDGETTTATFNNQGLTLTATNAAGGTTTNIYNPDGTVLSTTDPAGKTTTYAYDAQKRRILTTYPDTTTRSLTYDASDHILTATDERGHTTTFTYDDNGNLATVTDPLTNTTTFTYDGNDRVISITGPRGGITRQTYDAFGRVTSRTDPNDNTTTYTYNNLGRLTLITYPEGNTRTFTYDLEGLVTSSADQLGNTVAFAHDNIGRTTAVTDATGDTTQMGYDPTGQLSSIRDPLGKTTRYSHDPRGLLSKTELYGGVDASYQRDELGNITGVVDPLGNPWTTGFDNQGRLTSRTDPLGRTATTSYDSRNRPAVHTFPGSLGTLTTTFDGAGNLTAATHSDGTVFTFTYDDADRLVSASPGLALGYDANGQITATNGITITRDLAGRITAMTFAPGKTVTYAYDKNDRLTKITDWTGRETTFAYDTADRLVSTTLPNNLVATKTYDPAGRLATLTESTLSNITLSRDENGQITNAQRNVPATTTETPDAFADTDLTVDAASQLTGRTYDALGRLTTDADRTFTWNLASHLQSLGQPAGTTTYTYDALGSRLSKTADATTQNYVWNYALSLHSISIERTGATDQTYYIHTPGGDLLYSIDATTDKCSVYHYDETGNTIFLTDDTGTVTASFAYSAYGRLIATGGASTSTPFTWQGRAGVMAEGNNLYYIRARYYDANTANLISRDPIKSLHPKRITPYQYANANPRRFIDPSGLNPRSENERVRKPRVLVKYRPIDQPLVNIFQSQLFAQFIGFGIKPPKKRSEGDGGATRSSDGNASSDSDGTIDPRLLEIGSLLPTFSPPDRNSSEDVDWNSDGTEASFAFSYSPPEPTVRFAVVTPPPT